MTNENDQLRQELAAAREDVAHYQNLINVIKDQRNTWIDHSLEDRDKLRLIRDELGQAKASLSSEKKRSNSLAIGLQIAVDRKNEEKARADELERELENWRVTAINRSSKSETQVEELAESIVAFARIIASQIIEENK